MDPIHNRALWGRFSRGLLVEISVLSKQLFAQLSYKVSEDASADLAEFFGPIWGVPSHRIQERTSLDRIRVMRDRHMGGRLLGFPPMPDTALVIALFALLIALGTRLKISSHSSRLDDLEKDLPRQLRNLSAEVEESLTIQRRLLAKVAKGEELDTDQVEEGRLWRDASGAEALALVTDSSAHILDVRTPLETAGGHAEGAQLIPIDELEARKHELPRDSKPLLIYCAAGVRSAAACDYLSSKGRDGLHNLTGGYPAWTGPRTSA